MFNLTFPVIATEREKIARPGVVAGRLAMCAAVCALSFVAVSPARAQEDTPAANTMTVQDGTEPQQAATETGELTDAERQARLTKALSDLDKLTPRFDPETRRMVPSFRAILTRYYMDRSSLTNAERDIADALRKRLRTTRGGDLDLDSLDATFRKRVQKNAALAHPPRVTSGVRKVPGSAEPVGYIAVESDGQTHIIAEIPNGAGGLTAKQRAQRVANRLATATAADPLWWTQASVGRKKSNYVVAAKTAPDGYVITADEDYARLRGISPDRLASALTRDIRTVYGGPGATRAVDRSPEATMEAAADLRAKGDGKFNEGDTAGAEKLYRDAIERAPNYIPAYERLAGLYQANNQAEPCRDISKRALTLPNLTAAQKAAFTKMAK